MAKSRSTMTGASEEEGPFQVKQTNLIMQRGNGSVDLNNDHSQQAGSLQKHWTSFSKPVLFTRRRKKKKKRNRRKKEREKKRERKKRTDEKSAMFINIYIKPFGSLSESPPLSLSLSHTHTHVFTCCFYPISVDSSFLFSFHYLWLYFCMDGWWGQRWIWGEECTWLQFCTDFHHWSRSTLSEKQSGHHGSRSTSLLKQSGHYWSEVLHKKNRLVITGLEVPNW